MDSTDPIKKVKQTFSKSVYSWYILNGYDRFLKLNGKIPARKGEYEFMRTLDTLRNTMGGGYNVGVMIPNGQLVIDIDPRNGGIESFGRLLAEAYKGEPRVPSLEDMIEETFTVRTGGGGHHLYYAIGPGVKARGSISGYPGVDLKGSSENQYVVGPGSIHPDTRDRYVASPLPVSPAQLPAPLAPFVLAQLRDPFNARREPAGTHPLWGIISPEELATLLDAIDPLDYHKDHAAWQSLMAASSHATGGSLEAAQAFTEWSVRDPEYLKEAPPDIDHRWGTFHETRNGSPVATVDTLLHAVAEATKKAKEIEELLGEANHATTATANAAAVVKAVQGRRVEAELEVVASDSDRAVDLIDWIEALPKGWRQADATTLPRLINKISELQEIHWPELCAALAARAGGKLSAAQIKKHVRQERDARAKAEKVQKPTAARIVDTAVDLALTAVEETPGDVACAPGQPFRYVNGVWEKTDKEWFGHICYSQIEKFVDKDEKGTQALCNYARDAAASILHKRATQSKDLYYRQDIPSCINLLNGTLWLSKDGKSELKPHNREDYLTTQVPYNYDPNAKCPSFDKMLEQVFEHYAKRYSIAERDDFIRHFWELFGYAIQPNKDLPVAMFWIGEGQNGKSKIAEILSKLIGPKALLSTDMKAFFSGNNSHATASLEGKLLVVEDDLGSGTTINDGMLKRISKNSEIEINPKNEKSRYIISHTIALIITNTRVLIVDTSPGLVRRCYATYFDTSIAHLQGSPLPDIAIAEEMPGILNKAVEGLARLRERKDFKIPKCSIDDRSRFLRDSIPALGFWETLDKAEEPGATLSIGSLYADYRDFMLADGHGKPVSKLAFVDVLKRQNVTVKGNNVVGWAVRAAR